MGPESFWGFREMGLWSLNPQAEYQDSSASDFDYGIHVKLNITIDISLSPSPLNIHTKNVLMEKSF